MKKIESVFHLEVYAPVGSNEVVRQHAPRLPDLNGKTICELSNRLWEDFRIFPAIRKELQKRFPTAKIIPYTEFPGLYGTDAKVISNMLAEKKCDAVLAGNAA
jgi:hypothetical protein